MILGQVGKTNYQPQLFLMPWNNEDEVYLPSQFVSWCWISADQLIEPGEYEIPEDQQDNLEWFYDNNFRLDKFGRRHIKYAMQDWVPTKIQVI